MTTDEQHEVKLTLDFGKSDVWNGLIFVGTQSEFTLSAANGRITSLSNHCVGRRVRVPYALTYTANGELQFFEFETGGRNLLVQQFPPEFSRDFALVSDAVVESVDRCVLEGTLDPSESEAIRKMVLEIENRSYAPISADRIPDVDRAEASVLGNGGDPLEETLALHFVPFSPSSVANISASAADKVQRGPIRQALHSLADRMGEALGRQ